MYNFKNNFPSISLCDPLHLGGLYLYPILFNYQENKFNIKTFDDLYDQEQVKAKEIGESGVVGKIEINNLSNDYLLIFDGEAIIGAKQNRISEQTVILLPNSKSIIPVNCVERGRWSYTGYNQFNKSNFSASPKMRSKKAEILKEQQYENVQSEVWDEIDNISEKVSYNSRTSDLGEILRNRNFGIKNYNKEEIKNIECNGFLVFGTEKPFIELFFNKTICRKQILKSLDSWMVDLEYGVQKPENPNVFLEHFLNSVWDKDRSVGIETSYSSPRLNNGRSTFLEGTFIHGYYYF